jgi:hypothetical protein
MSLFLRKKCQEKLDEVGLENYHVQVDETSKCLMIVGECGQIMTTIVGIRLSRMAPNEKEIDLALELLDDFLTKHADNFREFLKVKARAEQAKVPQAEDLPDLQNVSISKQTYHEYWELNFEPLYAPAEVTVRSTGKITLHQVSLEADDPEEFDKMGNGLTLAEMNSVRYWLDQCSGYQKAIEEKKHVLSILSSCEV